MIKIFQKFYPKITKTRVIKNIDHYPINSRNYAAASSQTLGGDSRSPGAGKNTNIKKFKII